MTSPSGFGGNLWTLDTMEEEPSFSEEKEAKRL
jgi:hypothetical protein